MEVFIGIDTSNYTTSVAAVDRVGNVVSDRRILLSVKEGERGLRQHEALFQHVNNLPVLIDSLMKDIDGYDMAGIACSEKPRPCEGSYMPCFNAGVSTARSIAAVKGCPVYLFSHQEGHVAAASKDTLLERRDDFVFFHLSGGTTEAVTLPEYELVGKTLDISFGQLIDRAGVALSVAFPCGKELDQLALEQCDKSGQCDKDLISLPKIKAEDGCVNLSGIESACQRLIEKGKREENVDRGVFAKALFDRISAALVSMTVQISEKTGKKDFLFAGGVSSSLYIRSKMKDMLPKGIKAYFGKPELCRDNAVGIAVLGGKELWR